ncbi:Transposase OS=Sphingobium scionense OX=1404341 GN=GGQ90_003340 PE=4 SV=1 [Sphingobium scionense]|uniref:Transposase n=2 Tax=Sphingomonadaceae TaxID=41297 RepID=A0A7W6PW85_9SPHN|nr:hypothetical protein [Sphingobium scionense]SMP75759.1 hypothetical protein SAMN06296065_1095 [Novosphingobium panipatense]
MRRERRSPARRCAADGLLAPEPFEAAFTRFSAAFAGVLKGVVAIDGKALRGVYERGRKAVPLHLVNIWAAEARLVIGQRLAPGRNEVLGAQQALARDCQEFRVRRGG